MGVLGNGRSEREAKCEGQESNRSGQSVGQRRDGGWTGRRYQGSNARERQDPQTPTHSDALATPLQAGWQDQRRKVEHWRLRLGILRRARPEAE